MCIFLLLLFFLEDYVGRKLGELVRKITLGKIETSF